jgi:hypothetical protein
MRKETVFDGFISGSVLNVPIENHLRGLPLRLRDKKESITSQVKHETTKPQEFLSVAKPPVKTFKVLDLFCGKKGWSKPFSDRGHNVVSVDIEPKFEPSVRADINLLPPFYFNFLGPFDIVLASPPCTEFTKASLPSSWVSVKKYGCNPDTTLLQRTIDIIAELKPQCWVIENVRGAIPYFEPFLGGPVKKIGSRYLWGQFPMFDSSPKYGKWKLPPSQERPSLRSLIPYSISLALCLACETFTEKSCEETP